jgi:hypothetical protein
VDCAVQTAGDVDKCISSGVSSQAQCDSGLPCDSECRMFGKIFGIIKDINEYTLAIRTSYNT